MSNPFKTFERQIAEEKSEIKELKEAYDIVQDHLVKAEQRLIEKDKMITELADALEEQSCWSTKVELIQRAREVTKRHKFKRTKHQKTKHA